MSDHSGVSTCTSRCICSVMFRSGHHPHTSFLACRSLRARLASSHQLDILASRSNCKNSHSLSTGSSVNNFLQRIDTSSENFENLNDPHSNPTRDNSAVFESVSLHNIGSVSGSVAESIMYHSNLSCFLSFGIKCGYWANFFVAYYVRSFYLLSNLNSASANGIQHLIEPQV